MKMTLILDDELVARARDATGIRDINALVHEALQALIASESARHLASLAGAAPDMEPIPRRRSKLEE